MTSSSDLAGSELRFGRQLGWLKMTFHRSTISNKITYRGMAIVSSIECIYFFSFTLLLNLASELKIIVILPFSFHCITPRAFNCSQEKTGNVFWYCCWFWPGASTLKSCIVNDLNGRFSIPQQAKAAERTCVHVFHLMSEASHNTQWTHTVSRVKMWVRKLENKSGRCDKFLTGCRSETTAQILHKSCESIEFN